MSVIEPSGGNPHANIKFGSRTGTPSKWVAAEVEAKTESHRLSPIVHRRGAEIAENIECQVTYIGRPSL